MKHLLDYVFVAVPENEYRGVNATVEKVVEIAHQDALGSAQYIVAYWWPWSHREEYLAAFFREQARLLGYEKRFDQLKADVDHAISLKTGGYWSEDQIFTRMVEELGEIARCRRSSELERNSDVGRNDEEGECLDILYTLICYAHVKGFDLEARWKEDTYGRG